MGIFKKSGFLGSEVFVEEMKELIDGDKELSEVPSSQRRSKPLSLEEYELMSNARDDAIVNAYANGEYTQKDIGDYFGLHYARISRIIKKAKGKT